jgi:hypothetical protein
MEAPQKAGRAINTFKVPSSIGGSVLSVGLVELTADEEMMAEKRAGADRPRVAVELSKQALAEVNGKPVNLTDGSADTAWNSLPAKVRTLVITAYTRLHIPSDEEMGGFFASMEVRV